MTRYNDNAFRGILLFGLFLSLLLKSCTADAQKLNYLGYEIAASAPTHQLRSDISQLQDIKIPFTGIQVGAVMATHWAKYKAAAGLHYSNASLPYSFDLLTATMTMQAYLLRLKESSIPRSVEPYFKVGLQQGQTNYFGTYMLADQPANFSRAKETKQGSSYSTQLTTGAGFEYQLENENHNFIHFFADANYGVPIYNAASSRIFSGTEIKSTWSINFGVNFGISKER